jgi:hypothetical protein
MKIKKVGITQRELRKKRLQQVRNKLIRQLHAEFTYGEISQVIRIDKMGAFRIIKYGANTSRHVAASASTQKRRHA